MSLLAQNISDQEPLARQVWLADEMIHLELTDGRMIAVPLAFYPTLDDAPKEQREDFRIFASGAAIHFNQLDIDLSVESLVMGRKEIPGLMNKIKKLKDVQKLPLS